MRKLILIFFILTPLIDYTYRIKFASIGSIELSPNRIFKFIPIFLFIIYHFVTNRGFLWKNSTYLILSLLLHIRFLANLEIIIGVSILLYSLTIEPTRYPSFLWLFTAIASYLLVNKDKLIQQETA